MRIYTKTGDKGETGLIGGSRVSKADARVDAYGEVDEANSSVGAALAALPARGFGDLRETLLAVQEDLFEIGAALAAGPGAKARTPVPAGRTQALEKTIDRLEAELPALKTFILPGGSPAGAALHAARTVCRRAERRVVALKGAPAEAVVYLNRLSDLLFVMARAANRRLKAPERPWTGR